MNTNEKGMTKRTIAIIGIASALALATIWMNHIDTEIDFNTQIKPILNKHCISCHGGVKQNGELSMMTRADLLKAGESGNAAIVPGNPSKSEFYRRLIAEDEEERMPYQAAPLANQEIKLLKTWIQQGAKWGDHWAYAPVAQVAIPKNNTLLGALNGQTTRWARNPVDQFILKALKKQKLTPSPLADKATLLQRVALDLTGLPASNTLAKQFLESSNDNAFEQLVDSLLAAPSFGERWAATWMDLARYSDTKGAERDDKRSIWRYRDWLIQAFNQDMPYNQFLVEQIAGDLLPNPTNAQYIATGFHRNTVTNDEGGTDNEEFRAAAVVDRVNTTWEALMGTTFACVQCHGHPYDPIKHEEYYQFMAFFNNTSDYDTYADYPWLRQLSDVQQKQLDTLTNWLKVNASAQQAQEVQQFIKTWQPVYYSLIADNFVNAEIYDTKYLTFRNHAIVRLPNVTLTDKNELIFRYRAGKSQGQWQLHLDHPEGKVLATVKVEQTQGWTIKSVSLPEGMAGNHDLFFTFHAPKQADEKTAFVSFDWFYFTQSLPQSAPDYAKHNSIYWSLLTANTDHTLIMVENPSYMQRKTHVWDRGSWLVKTEEVKNGVPAIFPPLPDGAPNNRLGLALWLTDERHPLTARTIVNRIWEQLFGVGIVETLEDFGSQGIAPTHPELLDYLAWQFMHEHEWSVKKLLKAIVLSATYQQSSKASKVLLEKDPLNKWYARFPRVRLNAEQIRDKALFISGLLSSKMYGESVMPYQPDNIWNTPYNDQRWEISAGADKYRRSLYTYWKRSSPYPAFLTFDAADRNVCSTRRIRTNTPLQALVTLNDPSYMDAAVHLAHQNYTKENLENSISNCYAQAIGQSITPSKLDVLTTFYHQILPDFQQDEQSMQQLLQILPNASPKAELAALAMVCNAIMNLDEFIVKN